MCFHPVMLSGGNGTPLWPIAAQDENDNAIHRNVFLSGCRNAFVRSDNSHVALIALEDIVMVDTAGAAQAMQRDKAQEVVMTRTAKVTEGEKKTLLSEKSLYIPLEKIHKLKNTEKTKFHMN